MNPPLTMEEMAALLHMSETAMRQVMVDEGASPEQAREATRRILKHPDYRSGKIRSPGAFFRGVLRRVLTDALPPPVVKTAPPDEPEASGELGQAYCAAYRWGRERLPLEEIQCRLHKEYPHVPPEVEAELLIMARNAGNLGH